jgi:GDPmannose 4,6-dehydratase
MTIKKRALITGITGQDGAYLAEFLLKKGYEVHGLRRRVSSLNTERIDHLICDEAGSDTNGLFLHYGDVTDTISVMRVVEKVQPNEVYNLAAQSHVHVSFDSPEYTANADGLGTLRMLESLRTLGLKDARFYQASTSELFGKVQHMHQSETTPFYPRSPYAVAKLYAHWITVNYREAYSMFSCNGILFNHESPTRGLTFVTRKITSSIAKILAGHQKKLSMGNLNAKRDWGHAKDYVEAQWLMLQQEEPKDFVIATGQSHTIKEFIDKALACIGVTLRWTGTGIDEVGIVDQVDQSIFAEKTKNTFLPFKEGETIVDVDSFYFRPTEVDFLRGDATKAREELGWSPSYSFEQLVNEMMDADLQRLLFG